MPRRGPRLRDGLLDGRLLRAQRRLHDERHPRGRAALGRTHDLSACTNAHEPILIFHGSSDPVVPDGCDDPGASKPVGWSGPASADAWAAHNGCATTTTTTTVTGGTCTYYDGCPSDGQVAYCILQGMGHCWAGGAADGGIFSCPAYANATTLEWAFFQKYAW